MTSPITFRNLATAPLGARGTPQTPPYAKIDRAPLLTPSQIEICGKFRLHTTSKFVAAGEIISGQGSDKVEWICLTPTNPLGEVPECVCHDGIRITIPIDENGTGTGLPCGWLLAIEKRGGLLWVLVEWTDYGRNLLRSKAYQEIVVRWKVADDGAMPRLQSASLANTCTLTIPPIQAATGGG